MFASRDSDEDINNEYVNKTCLELSDFPQFFDFFNIQDNQTLKVFHSNIRSFTKNFDDLLVNLNTITDDLDLIVLTEGRVGAARGWEPA